MVSFLAEVRVATGVQIARRLWGSTKPSDSKASATRRALRRLEGWRVLDRLSRRMGGVRAGSASIVYCLGPAGRRLRVRDGFDARRLTAPGDRYVRHTLAITELVVRLHEADLAGDLDLIELQTEPRCWRRFVGLMGARLTLKPDLFVRVGSGAFEDRWWIEVDLATEAGPTVLSKAKLYLSHFRAGEEQRRHGVYPRVVWAVPDERRAEQVARALDDLSRGARRLFSVWLYDEAVGRLAAEAQT
ncbi:MAG TPA: replication-relaxation family protein [Thermoleophilaceae bacterium]|nr:replication-relaxation family protein [Thermoleophilaceae bacterium]